MATSKYRKLSHVVYKCDYHIVWTPKYRYRVLFGEINEPANRQTGKYSGFLFLKTLATGAGPDQIEKNDTTIFGNKSQISTFWLSRLFIIPLVKPDGTFQFGQCFKFETEHL